MTSILSTATRHSLQPRVAATALVLALAGGLALPAAGQTRKANAKAQTTTGAERNTWRVIREMPAEVGKAAAAESTASPWAFTMGVNGEQASSGHTLATPFSIEWTSSDWYLGASGDGYLHAVVDGVHSSGLADLALLVNRTITFGGDDRFGLTPEFELVLPSHGDVGSTHASQTLRLALARDLKRWGWAVSIGLARAGDAEPDVSRYTKSAAVKLHYDLLPDIVTTSFKMSRDVQAGAPASNTLGWSLRYVLPKSAAKATQRSREWSATLGLRQTRTASTASNTIALGIDCKF